MKTFEYKLEDPEGRDLRLMENQKLLITELAGNLLAKN